MMQTMQQIGPESFILANTTVQPTALVPEVQLHLASASREIFVAAETFERPDERWPPYWAFAWPGGQALARVLLDQPERVRGKHVVDIGAGSGLGAIAALRAGAETATAYDPDPLACAAAALNAEINGVRLTVCGDDPLGSVPDADLVLIGDLVYEPELGSRVGSFLEEAGRKKIEVLYGDRSTARRPPVDFVLEAEFRTTLIPELEEGYVEVARVWRLAQPRTAASRAHRI